MTVLKDDLILYHGSYCEIIRPDLQKCSRYKDFGQGFYLTTSYRSTPQDGNFSGTEGQFWKI